MDFGFASIVLLAIAALLIMAGAKLLFRRNWLLPFIRGFSGFALLLLALFVIMSGLNIATYNQLKQGQTIANISFKQNALQEFEATLVNVSSGSQHSFTLHGDMWQVDARIMRLAMISQPYYKLDRIGGRYYSLEQERSSRRSVFDIEGNNAGIDLWALFKGRSLGIVAADYGSATYSPMADDAVFAIVIGTNGLQARPVNESAKKIVNEWL